MLILSCRLIVSWILSGSKSRAPLHRQQQSSEAFFQATQRQVASILYLHGNCALFSRQMYMCKSTGLQLSAAKTWPLNDGREVRCNASAPGCFHTVLVVSIWKGIFIYLQLIACGCYECALRWFSSLQALSPAHLDSSRLLSAPRLTENIIDDEQ